MCVLTQAIPRYKHVLLDIGELPTADEVMCIFVSARLIAAKVRALPHFNEMRTARRKVQYASKPYKDKCFSLMNSYLRRAPMEEVGKLAGQLNPEATNGGYDNVYSILMTEYNDLMAIIVHDKRDFFWFFDKYFDRNIDKWN